MELFLFLTIENTQITLVIYDFSITEIILYTGYLLVRHTLYC